MATSRHEFSGDATKALDNAHVHWNEQVGHKEINGKE
jgi:hypothetical protein